MWGFLNTAFLSLSQGLSLPSLCLFCIYPFAFFSLLLFLFLCLYSSALPLSLRLSVFLPNLLTSNLKNSPPDHAPSSSPFPPNPSPLNSPPASLGCIAHCLGREQGVMFIGRGGGSSRAWGEGVRAGGSRGRVCWGGILCPPP